MDVSCEHLANSMFKRTLTHTARAIGLISLVVSSAVLARGVSPYLPLNLAPSIERKIEQVLILADKSVVRRPIPAAVVLDALPKACMRDVALCAEVRAYLSRYMHDAGVTSMQVEAAATTGDSELPIQNSHGMPADSPWEVSGQAFLQTSDYWLFNAGVVAYQGRATPTGTAISAGFDFAQLDIGYRDHWLSPMRDSSMLISTEAPTMPSITLSNYVPITSLGFNYELFIAEMSKSDQIVFEDGYTSGRPRLAGTQLGIEPISGYTFAAARTFQFGGGARNNNSPSALFNAFIDPTHYDQTDRLGNKAEFGNQMASIASSMVVPAKIPFAFRLEYAGEDTGAESYLIARTDLTLGLDFPILWRNFDAGFEVSEWQDTWYTHHLYLDGYRNHGDVLGHWFGDNRIAQDAPWGRTRMLRFGWRRESGDYLQATYRNLEYYFSNGGYAYHPMNEIGLRYSTIRKAHAIDLELSVGRDVFGENYSRLSASLDFVRAKEFSVGDYDQATTDESSEIDLFVDVGAARSRAVGNIGVDVPATYYADQIEPHIGVGVRRRVSEHNDLGMRVEFDRAIGRSLFSVRAIDYRHRFNRKLALTGFLGVSRYQEELPMYGFYWGAGFELTNVLPHWDVGLIRRASEKVMRAKVLSTDQSVSANPNLYYQLTGIQAYLSYRF